MIIVFSICGSCLGALLASYLSSSCLQGIFGTFLILVAIYMLSRKSATDEKDIHPVFAFHKIASGGFSIGFIASIVGSGGGILMVPFLHSMKFRMRYAVGTSTLIGFPVAISGALTYVLTGLFKGYAGTHTIGYVHWPAFLAITFAGVLFVPVGVKLSTVLPAALLQRAFAIVIIIMGMKMINVI